MNVPNPFIYGRPVRGDEFLDRDAELRTVFNRLRNGESTAVVGEPHIGKSSILNKLADAGAAITMTTSLSQSVGDSGFGLRLDYFVPVGKYASWETPLRGLNLSGYDRLTFYARRGIGTANPNVYLADTHGQRRFVNLDSYVSLSAEWQMVTIPLSDFGALDFGSLQTLQFVLEYEATLVQGDFYLDDLAFLPSADCTQGAPDAVYLPLIVRNHTPMSLDPIWDFEAGAEGWTHQTYTNSQAVISVGRSPFRSFWGGNALDLVVDLDGDDGNRSQGEAFVDMLNSPPPGFSAPLNLACKPVRCRVYVPTCGLGEAAAPNTLQLFVKDSLGRAEYGTPVEITPDRWFDVTLRPSTLAPLNGFKDGSFDPTIISQLGIKLRAGSGQAIYRGKVYVDACEWQEIDPPASAGSLATCTP